jgi:hypothetical protein
MAGVIEVGGWFAADGQTRGRLSLNNSLMISLIGALFLRTLDVKSIKKSKQFLTKDAVAAISSIGLEYFVGCIFDGTSACKGSLKLISKSPTFLWPQRCACHGTSLLSADIAKLSYFKKPLALMLKLISFVNNHGIVSEMLRKQKGALFRPALTRMCKLVIAAQRVFVDKTKLISVFGAGKMYEYMRAQGDTVDDPTIVDDEDMMSGQAMTLMSNYTTLKEECIFYTCPRTR